MIIFSLISANMLLFLSLRHPPRYTLTDALLPYPTPYRSRDAFSTIRTRGNQRLFRVALSVVVNDSEAEDVLQESYLRAFKAIGGFRGDSDVMTWLTRIVVNEARGRLRKRRPTVGLEQDRKSVV